LGVFYHPPGPFATMGRCHFQICQIEKKHYATDILFSEKYFHMRPPFKPLPNGSIGMPLRKTGPCAVIHSDLSLPAREVAETLNIIYVT